VVDRCASPFGRNHASTDRRLRRASRPENPTLPWLKDTLEHLSTLTGFRVGDPKVRERKLDFGIVLRKFRAQL
jgi:hypothetical protein